MITLAADFGGRRIKLGIVHNGCVVRSRVIPAQADQPLHHRLEHVAHELTSLCSEAGVSVSESRGVGFAYPSIIDVRNARILDHFGKFGDASQLDLRKWAQEALALPLSIDNDARMALIGEWRYGVGRGCNNVAIMTLGTGLGTSAVIEGTVLRGIHGQAGILGGHMTIQHNGRQCVCGNIGCSEAEASTWMLRELAKAFPKFASSPLSEMPEIDYAAVFQLAAAGDPTASALRDQSLKIWGVTAVNLTHAYDPELIIIGGGVMGSARVILPAIESWLQKHAHTPWGHPRVVASQLGDQAALLACEWLVCGESGPASTCSA